MCHSGHFTRNYFKVVWHGRGIGFQPRRETYFSDFDKVNLKGDCFISNKVDYERAILNGVLYIFLYLRSFSRIYFIEDLYLLTHLLYFAYWFSYYTMFSFFDHWSFLLTHVLMAILPEGRRFNFSFESSRMDLEGFVPFPESCESLRTSLILHSGGPRRIQFVIC